MGSSNGRTMGFGPINLGSNPSPTATLSALRDALKHNNMIIKKYNLLVNNHDENILRF